MKKLSLILSGAFLFSAQSTVFAADSQIKLTRNGKTITSVPIDKLNEVKISVSSGGPTFKQLFQGQWKGIDQALHITTTPYKKGQAAPSLDGSSRWPSYALARTDYDSTWSNKNMASGILSKAGGSLSLYKTNTHNDLIFTSRFRRKVYTGKTIWQKGGYVKQTRWETVGPYKGMAKLSLMPPTFANTLKPAQLFSGAVQKFNQPPENKFSDNKAMYTSRTLLYPTSYGGREVNFRGSEVLGFEKADGDVVYSWNYGDKGEWVNAKFPVTMKIKAVMNTKMGDIPVPMKTEAIFECPIDAVAERYLSSSTWEIDDVNLNQGFRDTCKTAEGKTADEVIKSANPLSGATDAGAAAKDLLKGFGF